MFHLRVKIIGRSSGKNAAGAIAYRAGGRSPAASMAYRAGVKLQDPRTGRTYDYTKKAHIDAEGFGILHTETMLPENAPAWLADRQNLIDAIEAKENRRAMFEEEPPSEISEITHMPSRCADAASAASVE